MRHSCAKTLARKYNLFSRAQVFKKFGKNLAPKDELSEPTSQKEEKKKKKVKTIEFYCPTNYKKKREFQGGENPITLNPFAILKWKVETLLGLFKSCLICGSEGSIEMHHVKHLRKENKDKAPGLIAIMSKMNRKQIPVCKTCHKNIHDGKYDGPSLKELQKQYRVKKVEDAAPK